MGTKKKILIVEDNVGLADLYQARLEMEGFEIKLVDDGEKALAVATEFAPDLVLLDVMMPQISGFDVLDILKGTDETKSMKVVILTALSQQDDKSRAGRLGADDYLVKSVASLDDVVNCVRKHVG